MATLGESPGRLLLLLFLVITVTLSQAGRLPVDSKEKLTQKQEPLEEQIVVGDTQQGHKEEEEEDGSLGESLGENLPGAQQPQELTEQEREAADAGGLRGAALEPKEVGNAPVGGGEGGVSKEEGMLKHGSGDHHPNYYYPHYQQQSRPVWVPRPAPQQLYPTYYYPNPHQQHPKPAPQPQQVYLPKPIWVPRPQPPVYLPKPIWVPRPPCGHPGHQHPHPGHHHPGHHARPAILTIQLSQKGKQAKEESSYQALLSKKSPPKVK